MSDRGMKKWNAYKTLDAHMPAVEKTMQNRYKKNIATMGKIETMNYEEKEDTDEVLDINIKKRRDSQSS